METKTHWKKFVNPNYLGAYSLNPGQELILTIKTVVREIVTGDKGKKEECTVIHRVEKEKPMILNRLNAKTISNIHLSPYIEDWAGKKVQIFATLVDAFGEKVEALRIRPFEPQVQKPTLTESMPAFKKAKEHIKGGGSIDNVEKQYLITEEIKALLYAE